MEAAACAVGESCARASLGSADGPIHLRGFLEVQRSPNDDRHEPSTEPTTSLWLRLVVGLNHCVATCSTRVLAQACRLDAPDLGRRPESLITQPNTKP